MTTTWTKLGLTYDENHYLVEMDRSGPTGTIYWRERRPEGKWREYVVSEREMLNDLMGGEIYVYGRKANRSLDRFFTYRVDESVKSLKKAMERAEAYRSGSPEQCGALSYVAREAIRTLDSLRESFEAEHPGILGDEPTELPNDLLEEEA